MLKLCLGRFLVSLEDTDLNVRRVALAAFNSAAHNKSMLVRDLLDTVLPSLYRGTLIKVLYHCLTYKLVKIYFTLLNFILNSNTLERTY